MSDKQHQSWDCMDCHRPLLPRRITTGRLNWWMSEAVIIRPDNMPLVGMYNGDGMLDSTDLTSSGSFTVFHLACWELNGSPPEFRGRAPASKDGGWFFGPGTYDIADPRGDELGAAKGAARRTVTVTPENGTVAIEAGHERVVVARADVPALLAALPQACLTGQPVSFPAWH